MFESFDDETPLQGTKITSEIWNLIFHPTHQAQAASRNSFMVNCSDLLTSQHMNLLSLFNCSS